MTQDELLQLVNDAVSDNCETLDLSRKEITHLPSEIGNLANLRSLDLSFNPLTSLPSEISHLTSLQVLNIKGTDLTVIPAEVGQLLNLRALDLSSTQISTLPLEISRLTGLQVLDLSYTNLKNLTETLFHLINLRSLNLSFIGLTVLPSSICQLNNLKELFLSSNKLEILPDSICQLTDLHTLYLNSNLLTTLPQDFTQLKNLEILHLSFNQLTTLPLNFSELKKIKNLGLSSIQLATLPNSIGKLANLQSLNLSLNQLTALPNNIGLLTNLYYLNLSFNQLSHLPDSIGQLINIKQLDARSNQLTYLPSNIAHIENLEALSIRSNMLAFLPESMSELTHLKTLDLRDNKLPIPLEILARTPHPTDIIRLCLQTQNNSASRPIYEAKFLIVGEGEVGKTTLAKKLVNPAYILDKDEKSTEGIGILPYTFEYIDGLSCQVNIWDFGGQEIYHATHQFFLTKRSLYGLVIDARKENPNLSYWLQVIQLYSGNSPVIIIKNEKQDRTCPIDNKFLSEFINLRESLATNLATNRGLDVIRTALETHISLLPQVGDRIPNSWINIRQDLDNLAQRSNYISIKEFRDVCEIHNVLSSEQQTLSYFLHDIGSILHFQNIQFLDKIIFLNPTWITGAVYKVLDAPRVIKNCGRFCTEDLDEIWSDLEYAELQSEFLRLMKQFEVCYEIVGSSGHYIAPHLLEINPAHYSPKSNWNTQNNLIVTYRYTFKPKNIFPRLIVSLHEYIERQKLVWKHGMVLFCFETRAEITEDDTYQNGNIRIRLSGADKKRMLSIIMHELGRINNSFDCLNYKILIPCNCLECKDSQSPQEFPYTTLRKSIARHNETIQCHRSFSQINVRQLIEDTIGQSTIEKSDKSMESGAGTDCSFPVVNVYNTISPQLYQDSNNLAINGDVEGSQIIDGEDNTVIHERPTRSNEGESRPESIVSKDQKQKETQIQDLNALDNLSDRVESIILKLSEEYDPDEPEGRSNIQRVALSKIRQESTLRRMLVKAHKLGFGDILKQKMKTPLAAALIEATSDYRSLLTPENND